MKKYNVLVIDDERLARTLMSEYVERIPQLSLVGALSNAMEAVGVLQEKEIDIILTDIEMPDMTGVDFVKTLSKTPAVIFTTAYSDYAVEGFELSAVDYLLKPISFPRFVQAINKAIESLDNQSKPTMVIKGDAATDDKNYITIKADYKIYKVNYEDLIYIEGQSEYVTFHTKHRNITAYYALKNLELQLPEKQFIRIHKSYIVSVKYVEFIESNFVSVEGNKIPIGASYKDTVIDFFKQ
ncbi:LytTR family DNA-binding domain-containing protein [Bacteroidales bacterium OttesenSCG-928-B11]|nr:LytTR family DNA-binding domain-containing protein [Bacteroidales bacterium OttesenSCG-928-C03]MDL2311657.1 LytTR family DNA-binding domain-containing protein [Bacteroidales bacterium OttesenSCG-928-B11]MDL2325773.1 LytTR family DNA-binding domain-containing protein [Bacteroidales bacterium OttesenSCG-928-A14]